MSPRRRRAGPEKVAELKALHKRGWLGQHCSNVLARSSGIHREPGQSGEDALVAFRQKRLARKRELNQNQRQSPEWIEKGGKAPPLAPPLPRSQTLPPGPPPGSGCDVMLSGPIVANPPGTPIEAPRAMRPDSPARPDATSLRGRVETLLADWERDRCRDLAAANDSTLPQPIREAARRAADVGGIYIEELDRMYHGYVSDIAS